MIAEECCSSGAWQQAVVVARRDQYPIDLTRMSDDSRHRLKDQHATPRETSWMREGLGPRPSRLAIPRPPIRIVKQEAWRLLVKMRGRHGRVSGDRARSGVGPLYQHTRKVEKKLTLSESIQ